MANEHSGRLVSYGLAIEGTRGTAETSPDIWYPRLDGVIDDKDEKNLEEAAQGTIAKGQVEKLVKQHSEGSLSGLVEDINFGYILNALMGDAPTPDDTPEAGTVYDHLFTVLESNLHQSLTIFKKDPLGTKKFAYCMIEGLSLEFLKDEILRFSMDVKGKKGEDDTDTVSVTAQNVFVPKHFTLKFAANQAGLDAAGETVVESASVEFTKGLEITWNDGEPNVIANTEFGITGEISIVYNADTHHDFVHDDDEKAIRLQMVNDDVTIGSASNPQLTIDIYRAVFKEWEKEEPLGGLVRETIKFDGLYSISDSKIVDITLRNTKNTAYDA